MERPINEKKHVYSMDQLKNWYDEGWVFRIRKLGEKKYITRRKGCKDRSLGPPTDELLKKIGDIQKETGLEDMFTKEEIEYLDQRSLENMVYFYRHELHQVTRGKGAYDVLPDNIRKMMTEHGIITRVRRGAYSITPLGKKMLEIEETR